MQPAAQTFVALAARNKGSAAAAGGASDPMKMAQAHACLACHGIGNKIVGPALLDVHKKYAAQRPADAIRLLTVRIKSGGTGAWAAPPCHRRIMYPMPKSAPSPSGLPLASSSSREHTRHTDIRTNTQRRRLGSA